MRFVAFVPGIMGSQLQRGPELVWSENAVESLIALVDDPNRLLLRVNDGITAGEPLKRIHIAGPWSVDIAERLYTKLSSIKGVDFAGFGYDWRRSINSSARELGSWITTRSNGSRTTLIGHSMGGLVCIIAVGAGHIPLGNVDKLILVGSPIYGAPRAFSGLYNYRYLWAVPWAAQLAARCRNKRALRANVLKVFQSFESLYELLPHPPVPPFVQIRGNGEIHPLNPGHTDGGHRDRCRLLHGSIDRYLETVIGKTVPADAIVSVAHRTSVLRHIPILRRFVSVDGSVIDTDARYLASPAADPTSGCPTYSHVRVTGQTTGDGTVPRYSATANDTLSGAEVVGVEHSRQCGDARVVDEIVRRL